MHLGGFGAEHALGGDGEQPDEGAGDPGRGDEEVVCGLGVIAPLSWGPVSQDFSLSAPEVRVLGCLMEKQRTTPDQYPLSLNALRLACNQSTNRDPVVDYDEATIRDALHRLERRRMVRLASGAGSRAAKYRHLLAEGVLPLEAGEHATMTVLMLRGPQTPGELKQRTERMHAFADLAAIHETLEGLIERELVRRLDRRPGQKEERYEQLLQEGEEEIDDPYSGSSDDTITQPSVATPSANGTAPAPDPPELRVLTERVERLEREVAELRLQMRNPSPSAP